jgi:hypothetical protein
MLTSKSDKNLVKILDFLKDLLIFSMLIFVTIKNLKKNLYNKTCFIFFMFKPQKLTDLHQAFFSNFIHWKLVHFLLVFGKKNMLILLAVVGRSIIDSVIM